MATADAVPISPESVGFLEDVKKGKPRKFAMICKGSSIVSLVIYKKGSLEKYKKEAKEAGKGQFYFGVLDGKGPNISFKLARSDGFDKQPAKTAVLKQFVNEHSGMKFKALFEIVDSAPLVLDDSDPLVVRFLALQEQALAAADVHEERAGEINQYCLAIGQAFDADDSDTAASGLDNLETLLKGLAAEAPGSKLDPLAEAYGKLHQALLGSVQKLEKTDAEYAAKVSQAINGAAAIAQRGDTAKAVELLKGVATKVAAKNASAASESKVNPKLLEAIGKINKEVQAIRAVATQQLSDLEAELRQTDDQDAEQIADGVSELIDDLPYGLEDSLAEYAEALSQADEQKVDKVRKEVKTGAFQWREYLAVNARSIAGCENNPWKISVQFATRARNIVKAIEKVTQ